MPRKSEGKQQRQKTQRDQSNQQNRQQRRSPSEGDRKNQMRGPESDMESES